tara:strand:+ start:126 stop:257 length:132 start_codon:yes stop_codon:yes gene_type:complete
MATAKEIRYVESLAKRANSLKIGSSPRKALEKKMEAYMKLKGI